MKVQGRFITLDDLRPRLDTGTGTLIMQWGQKGTYRIWWTEDDLFSLGEPVSARDDFIAVFQGQEHAFNTRCQQQYLDDETGRALLTSIPPRYGRSGKLARMFPRIKVAAVVQPFGSPREQNANDK